MPKSTRKLLRSPLTPLSPRRTWTKLTSNQPQTPPSTRRTLNRPPTPSGSRTQPNLRPSLPRPNDSRNQRPRPQKRPGPQNHPRPSKRPWRGQRPRRRQNQRPSSPRPRQSRRPLLTTAEAEPQAEPEPRTAAAARKRPSRRVLVAGGVVALVAAVGIGTGIAVTSGSSQPARQSSSARAAPTTVSRAPTAPSAGPTRPAAPIEPATIVGARAWLKTNIARSQRISADPNLVGELRSAGFTAAHVAPGYPGAPDWRADNIIISTPETRARAASAPALTAELASSIPVAVFGTGTQSVEARMVFGTQQSGHPVCAGAATGRCDESAASRAGSCCAILGSRSRPRGRRWCPLAAWTYARLWS